MEHIKLEQYRFLPVEEEQESVDIAFRKSTLSLPENGRTSKLIALEFMPQDVPKEPLLPWREHKDKPPTARLGNPSYSPRKSMSRRQRIWFLIIFIILETIWLSQLLWIRMYYDVGTCTPIAHVFGSTFNKKDVYRALVTSLSILYQLLAVLFLKQIVADVYASEWNITLQYYSIFDASVDRVSAIDAGPIDRAAHASRRLSSWDFRIAVVASWCLFIIRALAPGVGGPRAYCDNEYEESFDTRLPPGIDGLALANFLMPAISTVVVSFIMMWLCRRSNRGLAHTVRAILDLVCDEDSTSSHRLPQRLQSARNLDHMPRRGMSLRARIVRIAIFILLQVTWLVLGWCSRLPIKIGNINQGVLWSSPLIVSLLRAAPLVWQMIALLPLHQVIADTYATEWMYMVPRVSLVDLSLDRVSILGAGPIDRLKHSFSPGASLRFRISFLMAILLVPLHAIAPSATLIRLIPDNMTFNVSLQLSPLPWIFWLALLISVSVMAFATVWLEGGTTPLSILAVVKVMRDREGNGEMSRTSQMPSASELPNATV